MTATPIYTNGQHDTVQLTTIPLTGSVEARLLWGSGGVFNHHLFHPGEPARSLEQLRSRLTLVKSEFDVLQLQSAAARLAELEKVRPEGGYLKAAAAGLIGEWDIATVAALGRMAEPIQLLAGGSGIVPLMSMIRSRLVTQSAAPFRLLYSVRSPDRVWYRDELQTLVADGIGVTLAYRVPLRNRTFHVHRLPVASSSSRGRVSDSMSRKESIAGTDA